MQYEIPSCSICFDECLTKLTSLECGHVFHHSCVVAWGEKEKKCPLCRKAIRFEPPELVFVIKAKEIDESARFASFVDTDDKVSLEKLLVL